MADSVDKRAPMASAPMKYFPDGSVDWGDMWDSFCALAREGGPPHRDTMLYGEEDADPTSENYRFAVDEIIRGVNAVSGLTATPSTTGWIAVQCPEPGMARWLSDSILEEHVQARCEGATLFVPVGASYTLKGEIKNVITAVAKTTHYWSDHLPVDVKRTLAVQEQFGRVRARVLGWLGRSAERKA